MRKMLKNDQKIKRHTRFENSRGKTEIGITLIALVIGIIVLLILAGVSIATLTGENRYINTGK